MKKLFTLLFLSFLCTHVTEAQNSLLWKISGNDLKKDSYLYGTMHVSERIAFHLDDVFFESLLKSDYVALESNPENWLEYSFESGELMGNYNHTNSSGKNFYNEQFKFDPPNISEISGFLSNEHYVLNGILYRTSPMMLDFQEETYLDMFIFQSGSKYNKKVVGLEDIERSSNLVKEATKGNFVKESPDVWLQKMMKEKGVANLMSDLYRDRNIALLDSINAALYNDKYLENMLYIRNEDMVKSIDSLVKHGSVFSAIGAAHLAGEKGVIQKLRDRGYTVTPLGSKITSKGKKIKEEIEEKEAKVTYKRRVGSDKFFSVNSPSKLYELGYKGFTICLSPNIQNGAYYTIARINTMTSFGGEIRSLTDMDKILFENIPGNIVSKKEIEKNGYKGLDIVNQTKVGDYQRYQIFLTPLEVVVFKMAGKRKYVLKNSKLFFDSIELKDLSSELITVAPKHKGFEVTMPKFYTFNNSKEMGNRFVQSMDAQGNYYFLKEVVLNDLKYIEEDDFELKRIHDRFYKNMELTLDKGRYEGKGKSRVYISKSTKTDKEKYTHLKTIIKGGYYYLMGKIGKDSTEPTAFFDSFKLTALKQNKDDLEVKKDTSLHYSVKTRVKPSYEHNGIRRSKKKYEPYVKTTNYYAKTNEHIEVKLKKFHDWKSFKNIDSLWNYEIDRFARVDLTKFHLKQIVENGGAYYRWKEKFKITNKTAGKDAFGNESITYLMRDTLSDRAIKVKKVLVDRKLYTLKTLVDVRHEDSEFVREFFNTFQPQKDTSSTDDLFQDKVAVFVKALKNGDSLAFDSYSEIKFKKEHINQLIALVQDTSLNSNQQLIKDYLIGQLTELKSKKVEEFTEDLYKESFNNPYSQIAIFKSLAKEKNKKSLKKLLKLLRTDIPITNKKSSIKQMFLELKDSLPLTKELFPELLNYTTVDDYKEPIYHLLAGLVEKELIKPKEYRKYKSQILTEARIELKRQLSYTINKRKDRLAGTTNYNRNTGDLLESYIKILMPFAQDKNNKELFSKISLLENTEVKTTYIAELIRSNQDVPKKLLYDLAKDIKGRYHLFTRLKEIGRLDVLPKEFLTKEKIYEAIILKNEGLKDKDSILFIGSRNITIKGKAHEAYFFKVKSAMYSYAKPKWTLHFAAFKKEEEEIQPKAIYTRGKQYIDETESLEDQLKIHLEKIRLKDRKRVDLSVKRNYGYF